MLEKNSAGHQCLMQCWFARQIHELEMVSKELLQTRLKHCPHLSCLQMMLLASYSIRRLFVNTAQFSDVK